MQWTGLQQATGIRSVFYWHLTYVHYTSALANDSEIMCPVAVDVSVLCDCLPYYDMLNERENNNVQSAAHLMAE